MPLINWISDEQLEKAVNDLLNKAKKAQNKVDKKFEKNVIDPFSALFSMSGFQMDYDTWYKNETARQAQKTLQNHIGAFHQNILGEAKQ